MKPANSSRKVSCSDTGEIAVNSTNGSRNLRSKTPFQGGKRLLSAIILALILILTGGQVLKSQPLPYFELAGIRYETTGINTVKVSAGGSYFGNIEIPNSVSNNGTLYTVTSIGGSAFYSSSITGISLPNTLISIGNDAFSGCSLTSVVLPDALTTIGSRAFNACLSLSNLTIPGSVTSIGATAFGYCRAFTSVNIPTSVTSIGDYAWYECTSLQSIYCFKANPLTITTNVFYNVNKSTCKLYVPAGSKALYLAATGWNDFTNIIELGGVIGNTYSVDNINYKIIDNNSVEVTTGTYEGSILIPEKVSILNWNYNVTGIGNTAFFSSQNLSTVYLPSSVTSIGRNSFGQCTALTTINFPNSLTRIGESAFYNCNSLTEIAIPSSVVSIGVAAFGYCKHLTNLIIPTSITSISDAAFTDCVSLTNIEIPASVTSIGNSAFYHCSKLTNVKLPASINFIGNYAFGGCSGLISFTIPDAVKSINSGAFYGCVQLKNILIPETVNFIGDRAFLGCSGLTNISIPVKAKINLDYTFYGCSSLKNITLPDSVVTIGNSAFYGCSCLSRFVIPPTVTHIGQSAFENCSNLQSIYAYPVEPATVGEYFSTGNMFEGVDTAKCTLYVNKKSVEKYRLSPGWKKINNIEARTFKIHTENIRELTGRDINVPVMSSVIFGYDSVSAYQFELKYDAERLHFKNYETDALLTNAGSVIVNSLIPGVLKVGFMSDAYLQGEGSLINLHFTLDKSNVTTPLFSKFLMNSTRPDSIKSGNMEIIAYGDVDYNQEVQSYDAALVLVNSVGLNPLPTVDPTPWEALRNDVADVDGNSSITAYDAGLILKKSVDLIDKFPVENSPSLVSQQARIAAMENADVKISEENNQLVFRSYGEFVGMNLVVTGNISSLDKPLISSSVIQAKNIHDDVYNVGLASATPPANGTVIMRIPVKNEISADVTLSMTINDKFKVVTISKTITGIDNGTENPVRLFLNPRTSELKINNPEIYRLVEIVSVDGKKVFAGEVPEDGVINIGSMDKAIYLVAITDMSGVRTVEKIIKR